MEHYYGILHKEQFEATFHGLAIMNDAQRDTSLESSFYVLTISLPGTLCPNPNSEESQGFVSEDTGEGGGGPRQY